MTRAWTIPLVMALLAPLLTWLPFGVAMYVPAQGIDLWGVQAWWLMAFGLLAAIIGTSDRWLAAAVFLAGLTIFVKGYGFNATHSLYFGLGALALWAVRQTPPDVVPRIRGLLAAAGCFQALYMIQQEWLQYDFFWSRWFGLEPTSKIQPLGTLGTVDAASAMVAITSALMPWWALPIATFAIFSGRSYGAILALGAVVVYRCWREWRAWGRWGAVALGLLGVAALWVTISYKSLAGVAVRAQIWGFGLRDWWAHDPVFGPGLGGWAQRIPYLQYAAKFMPTNELFREAHSEWLQWLYETGLLGGGLLAGWLYTQRRMVQHPTFGPAVIALAVVSCGFFTFHVVPTALLGLLVVGLASAQHPQPEVLGG